MEPLDPGEQDAISLAAKLKADLLLLDDAAGREVAGRNGIAVAGTIGILERAATNGLLGLPEAFERLLQTNFRVSDQIVEDALARDARRRQAGSTVQGAGPQSC